MGWVIARQRSSHIILVRAGHPATLSVPDHREVARGTLRSLIRKAGLSVEEFARALE
jgi:predicted RNA binding protein YcfA (HicA-like mRNA interferase family)